MRLLSSESSITGGFDVVGPGNLNGFLAPEVTSPELPEASSSALAA